MADQLPPADWFPDPTGRHEQRWWDGGSWTEHVFTAGAQSVDPLDVTTGPGAADDPTNDTNDDATAGDAGDDAAAGDAGDDDAAAGDAGDDATAWDTTAGDAGDDDATADDGRVEGPRVEEPQDPAATEQPADAPPAARAAAGTSAAEPGAPDPAPDGPTAAPSAHDELRALADDLAGPSDTAASDQAPQGWFLLDAPVRVAPGERPAPSAPTPAAPEEGPGTPSPDGTTSLGDESAAAGPSAPARPIPGGFVAGRPAPIDPAPPAASPPAAAPPTPAGPEQPDTSASPEQPTHPPTTTGRLVGPLVDAVRDGTDGEPVSLENRRLLRVRLDGGSVLARQGTMVAHRGSMDVRHEGAGGIGRVLRRAATGEGVRMMRVTGDGEVYLADGARHVFLLHLEGGAALSVSGRSVLAFSDGLDWQVERVQGATIVGGGLFATTLRGDGWVALVSDGEPVVLRADDAPVLVDTQALVAWTAGLATSVATSVKLPALVGLGSGEAVQLQFTGDGLVVVQPSEGRTTGT